MANLGIKKRDSNIELLRIISVIMIIAGHSVTHGIMDVDGTVPYVYWTTGSLLNRVVTVLFVPGGDVAVGCFFLITGYFLSGREEIRGVGKVLETVSFYAGVSIVVETVIMIKTHSVNLSILDSFAPLSSSLWWFASAYVLLILISPAISHFMRGLSEKQYWTIVFFLWIVWYVFGKIANFAYYPLLRALWFYLLGGALHKYPRKHGKLGLVITFVGCWIAYSMATFIIGTQVGIKSDTILSNLAKLSRAVLWGPLASAALFEYFINLNIRFNSFINNLARNSLGIYLLHEMPCIREIIWFNVFRIKSMYEQSWFMFYCIVIVVSIFVIGCCIEFLRDTIFNIFHLRFGENNQKEV